MIFGKKIRELRDEQGVLQRQLAALLEIDTPMFSKIERGDRRAKREHVIKRPSKIGEYWYFHLTVPFPVRTAINYSSFDLRNKMESYTSSDKEVWS